MNKTMTATEAQAESENQREMTFGEKAVGMSFNPGKFDEVTKIKESAADFIDVICGEHGEKVDFKQVDDPEVGAMRKLAQRHAQEAQMWAVKAATWNK